MYLCIVNLFFIYSNLNYYVTTNKYGKTLVLYSIKQSRLLSRDGQYHFTLENHDFDVLEFKIKSISYFFDHLFWFLLIVLKCSLILSWLNEITCYKFTEENLQGSFIRYSVFYLKLSMFVQVGSWHAIVFSKLILKTIKHNLLVFRIILYC